MSELTDFDETIRTNRSILRPKESKEDLCGF